MKRYRIIYHTSDGEQGEEILYAPNKIAAYEEFAELGYEDVVYADCYLITEFTKTIVLPQEEIDRINYLLDIDNLEEMSEEELEEIGAKRNTFEPVFCVDFEDGSVLTFDLCSGFHNYYDAVVWTSRDFKQKQIFDCTYVLEDLELEINGRYYVVNIVGE